MWYHPKLSYKRSWKSFVFTGIIDGHPAKTKAGELSIVPKEIQILAPCMKILPTTGLVDQSFKYRHRHVDLMLNPQVRSIFYTRSKIVNSIRQYLNSELFLFPWAIYCHYLTSFLRAIFVDLMLNPQVRSIFYTRSRIINSIFEISSQFDNFFRTESRIARDFCWPDAQPYPSNVVNSKNSLKIYHVSMYYLISKLISLLSLFYR